MVIETPPYFHPAHAAAAVDAGKHVFCAKPVAVDVPDSKSFLASGQRAQSKGLSFWVDFQSRARPVFQEAVTRIERGDIGMIAMAQVFYYANRPWVDRSTPDMDPGQKRIVNWLGDRVISGDIIVEQNVHVLDMANWYLGGHPLKATGAGGRTNWAGPRVTRATPGTTSRSPSGTRARSMPRSVRTSSLAGSPTCVCAALA